MKKPSGPDHSLESLRIFPYVAWGLIFCFVFFVYNMSLNLKEAAADLQIQTELNEVNTIPTTLKNPTSSSTKLTN